MDSDIPKAMEFRVDMGKHPELWEKFKKYLHDRIERQSSDMESQEIGVSGALWGDLDNYECTPELEDAFITWLKSSLLD